MDGKGERMEVRRKVVRRIGIAGVYFRCRMMWMEEKYTQQEVCDDFGL